MQAANAGLVGLVRSHLPFRIYGGERWWALFRTAALVRMADTVESLMDLMAAEQYLDGQILVRSLYEQVATFAWLSIDPDTRQWRRVGYLSSRLRGRRDWRRVLRDRRCDQARRRRSIELSGRR
jgi:hypothetical protein